MHSQNTTFSYVHKPMVNGFALGLNLSFFAMILFANTFFGILDLSVIVLLHYKCTKKFVESQNQISPTDCAAQNVAVVHYIAS